MYAHNNILAAVFLAAGLVSSAAAQAGDRFPFEKIKPASAITFDAGDKHASSYFLTDGRNCHLVVTVAAEPNWEEETPLFVSSRFEGKILASQAKRIDVAEGHTIEFGCDRNALTMSAREVSKLAKGQVD